ncbi:hypothetical protein ACOMHN_019869 [Nucella lapillus]
MGVVEIPRKLVHNYFRFVGLGVLLVYAVLERGWNSYVRPALGPVESVYETIDRDKLTVVTIANALTRALLMVGMLYWRMVTSLWQSLTSPFRKQIDEMMDEVRASAKMADSDHKEE